MIVHCEECGHEWDVGIKLPLAIKKFAKRLTGVRMLGCPECGADDMAIICGPAKQEKT